MRTIARTSSILLCLVAALGAAAAAQPQKLEQSMIFIEYNSTDNDLGFHVALDGEDWTSLRIVNPAGAVIFQVAGQAGYKQLGLSELTFEGAEPTLDTFPLSRLLELFPEGTYGFTGVTVSGARISGKGVLTHAVPAGPSVAADVNGDSVVIRWTTVTGPPAGFPNRRIDIAGYQVIVDPFQVTLPATSNHVTLPVEFVQSLAAGAHGFEVLAIEAGGNQTITAGSFTTR